MITVISKTGPFFSRDPVKTFRANVRDLMDAVAEIGEADVKAQMSAAGREGAAVKPYVRGRTSNLSGRRWASTAYVSVDVHGLSAKSAVRIMAIAAGRHNPVTSKGRNIGTTLGVEGKTHAFRRTTARMARQRKVIMADLLKGLT